MRNAKFIRSQLEAYFESQKWIWTILAGFATFKATTMFIDTVQPIDAIGNTQIDVLLNSTTAFYLFFIITIYRFYVSDHRILDYYYVSVPSSYTDEDPDFVRYLETLTPSLMVFDGVTRVFLYLLFYGAAYYLGNDVGFCLFVGALLIADAFFSLIIFHWPNGSSRDALITTLLGYHIPFEENRYWWFAINIIVGSLVVWLAISKPEFFFSWYKLALLALFGGALIDFCLCRRAYLPSIGKFIRVDERP